MRLSYLIIEEVSRLGALVEESFKLGALANIGFVITLSFYAVIASEVKNIIPPSTSFAPSKYNLSKMDSSTAVNPSLK
ncbi:Uncharacterised protein [Legionella busanensis]|uniref:Uncharacterized protein n=1 Tax=Legionella busanensis TaxID=190655 RepID=A0A378JK97_9GAMM|nr:Uncharacterised protein [Legionella busanensis]